MASSIVSFASRNLLNRAFLSRPKFFCLRCLTTGRKDKASNELQTRNATYIKEIPDFSKPLENKNWISHGFDTKSEIEDKVTANVIFFLMISVCFVYGSLYFYYMPDQGHMNWARREAFIRLHEREKLGLELVDPNYVDPSEVELPSDEELGDMEIII